MKRHSVILTALLAICQLCEAATIASDAGTQTASAPATLIYTATGLYAEAKSDWGYDYSISNANCWLGGFCTVAADTGFSDSLVFDINGLLHASITIMATASNGDGIAASSFAFGSLHESIFGNTYVGTPCFGHCILSLPITAGVPISFSGHASVQAQDLYPSDPFQGSETDTAGVAFSFSVTTTGGGAVSGFHYAAESGHDYGILNGIDPPFVTLTGATPEPGTVWLLAAGVLAVGVRRYGAR